MRQIDFNILDTVLVDDISFIDVVSLDGELKTQLMVKIEEPNEYTIKHTIEGNSVEDMLKYIKNNEEDIKVINDE